MTEFVDPYTKHPLSKDDRGNLFYVNGDEKIIYQGHEGKYNFSFQGIEEQFYDQKHVAPWPDHGPISFENLEQRWHSEHSPWSLTLLESLGDLTNRRILLLGNGVSIDEFYFLKLGASIVFTDLAFSTIISMSTHFADSELFESYNKKVEFHAVDALNLPFPDASFDIIYGSNFVHHIDDDNLPKLFSEICRCLKPGGKCRFSDGAYSPIWQFSKATFLRPLQVYTHKTIGLSPQDLKATKRGGYRQEEVAELMGTVGFASMVYIRQSFFLPLFTRGVGKLLGWQHRLIQPGSSTLKALVRLDETLADRSRLFKKNTLSLVWGFDK
jgi:SAM-dependent methyltransferase